LWKDLVRAIKKTPRRVGFEWVKGHSKDAHNKAVDKLAKTSAKGYLQRPLKVTAVRRKRSTKKVDIGCVPMQGQVMTIRLITDTYLRVQKVYKCKYEVLEGEFTGRIDVIFAAELHRAGHHYDVRVNDSTRNPRIVELIREIDLFQ
jgi:hypothetical protein